MIKFVRDRNITIKKVHYEQNFIYLFLNCNSTVMDIKNYIATVFKYEIISDIHCSLKKNSNIRL